MSEHSLIKASGAALGLAVLLVGQQARALQPIGDFVAAARARNLDRKEAEAIADQRAEEAKQSWSRLLPTASARASYTRNERATEVTLPGGAPGAPRTTVTITPVDQLDATFSLTLPLVDVGAWERIGAASALADAARARSAGAADDAEKSVTRAYYQVVAAEATLVAARRALDTAVEGQAVAGRRQEAGSASELDVQRARAQAERARQVVVSADQSRVVARRALGTLSGLAPSEGSVPLPEDGLDEAPPLAALEPGVATLPLVRAAEIESKAAAHNERAAWAALAPTASASGSERLTNATGFSGYGATWSLGVTLSWTLDPSAYFAARAQGAARAAASVREQKARAAGRDDLFNAWQEVKAQIARCRAARAEEEAAARAAKLARDRLASGAATQLDVLQADRDAFNGEVARIQAYADLAYARALVRIAGGKAGAR